MRALGACVSVRRPSSTAANTRAALAATDARDSRQVVARRPRQAVRAAARHEQLVGDGQRVNTAAPASQHHRDKFVITERGNAVPHELLARTVVRREVFHSIPGGQLSVASRKLFLSKNRARSHTSPSPSRQSHFKP